MDAPVDIRLDKVEKGGQERTNAATIFFRMESSGLHGRMNKKTRKEQKRRSRTSSRAASNVIGSFVRLFDARGKAQLDYVITGNRQVPFRGPAAAAMEAVWRSTSAQGYA